MNIPSFSIKRPAFITSLMIVIITIGIISFNRMSVNLFPDVDIPVIFISTNYPGAGPKEVETAVTKILEDEISTISGIKKITSNSLQDVSQIIISFYQGTDMKYAEQQVRDKINQAEPDLPDDIKESVIRKVNPSDQSIMTIAISADLSEADLFDLADEYISPRIEQVKNVGMVEILGGRKREIQILLDQEILKKRDISFSQVRKQLENSGENVPIGKNDIASEEIIFSSDSEFNDLEKINKTLVNFYSNDIPTKISDIGIVVDTLEDESSRAFINGKKALFLDVYRQSDSNIIAVVDRVKKQIKKMEGDLSKMAGVPEVKVIKDASVFIEKNVFDIYETITIAIILTVITVFFFLADSRATIITAISLPIALISAFILMYMADFSINVVSLLAMSLAVGLLVDDAIVVVENIYRKIENGENAKQAAISGTTEILIAVIAITLVVVVVFTPVSFMKGVVGQYLKEFGLTIAFAMLVSLFVAITIIPVLCAYLSGRAGGKEIGNKGKILQKFDNFQSWMEEKYEKILIYSINNPIKIIFYTIIICAFSLFAAKFVSKTFINESDRGEVMVGMELNAESNLDNTNKTLSKIDKIISKNQEVLLTASTAGSKNKQANKGEIYIKLKDDREITTSEFKEKIRNQIKDFAYANPIIKDYDPSGGASRNQPLNLGLVSNDSELLEKYAAKLVKYLKKDKRITDIDSSNKDTRNEIKITLKEKAAKLYGVNDKMVGDELRGYIEGYEVAKFRQSGYEYDIRLRLREDQRDLKNNFDNFYVTNINNKLVKLSDIAILTETKEASRIDRQDRGRYIRITGGLALDVGLGDVIKTIEDLFAKDGDLKLPSDIRYSFDGDSENMQDMIDSTISAMFISILFIYLILASLYESFVTPFTILLALPFALCGVFFGLFITGESISIFTILGLFMLLAVAGKNSILLIDFTNHLIEQGKSRQEALIRAGKIRLRPILMTTFSLIAGTLPVAIGLNEVSQQRTGMGVAIISGLISSTILTLIVVPAVFSYIDRFRVWSRDRLSEIIVKK